MRILISVLLSVAILWLTPSPATQNLKNSETKAVANQTAAGLRQQELQPAKPTVQVPKVQAATPLQETRESQPEAAPEAKTVAAPVPDTPKDIAKAKAAERGWTGAEWNALEELWHNESGWKPTAKNPSSGACGIPQAYPCSKIPNPSSVESQIDWGLEYVAKRYTTPSKALAFWHNEAPKYNGSNWY